MPKRRHRLICVPATDRVAQAAPEEFATWANVTFYRTEFLRQLWVLDDKLQQTKLRVNPHSHSIINRPPKPAWLKDLAVIDMGLYRRFYRQKRRSFAGAGDGAILEGATFSAPSSIR